MIISPNIITPLKSYKKPFNPLNYSPRNGWTVDDVSVVGSTLTWNDQVGGLNLSNPTAASEPILTTGVINGKSAVVYDGVDDNTNIAVTNYGSTYSSGQFIFVFRTPSSWGTNTFNAILNSNNSGSFQNEFNVNSYNVSNVFAFSVRNAGVVQGSFNTSLGSLYLDTNYVLSIQSNGTNYRVMINSVVDFPSAITDTGAWTDSRGATNSLNIGNLNRTAVSSLLKFAEIWHFPYISDAQSLAISNGFKNKYGI